MADTTLHRDLAEHVADSLAQRLVVRRGDAQAALDDLHAVVSALAAAGADAQSAVGPPLRRLYGEFLPDGDSELCVRVTA